MLFVFRSAQHCGKVALNVRAECSKSSVFTLPVSGVKTSITDHFIVLFRNVLDETLYEFHDRDGFLHMAKFKIVCINIFW